MSSGPVAASTYPTGCTKPDSRAVTSGSRVRAGISAIASGKQHPPKPRRKLQPSGDAAGAKYKPRYPVAVARER